MLEKYDFEMFLELFADDPDQTLRETVEALREQGTPPAEIEKLFVKIGVPVMLKHCQKDAVFMEGLKGWIETGFPLDLLRELLEQAGTDKIQKWAVLFLLKHMDILPMEQSN